MNRVLRSLPLVVALASCAAPEESPQLTQRMLSGRGTDEERSGDLRPAARLILDARAWSQRPLVTAGIGPTAQAFELPETIRVWRRGLDGSESSCSGRVDELSFDEYVKGVLPHEWIASWEPAALETGAVVVRTYAAAWVAMGGKYDCADVDDTTASQVYKDEFYPATDDAVDATAGLVLVNDGELVFAEYSAENGDPTEFGVSEPYCTGLERKGHGRGTCQWGSQRWALNEGRDFAWIATHYYPGSLIYDTTGDTPMDPDPQEPPPDPDPDPDPGAGRSGDLVGGCSAAGGRGSSSVALLLLVALELRRRRS